MVLADLDVLTRTKRPGCSGGRWAGQSRVGTVSRSLPSSRVARTGPTIEAGEEMLPAVPGVAGLHGSCRRTGPCRGSTCGRRRPGSARPGGESRSGSCRDRTSRRAGRIPASWRGAASGRPLVLPGHADTDQHVTLGRKSIGCRTGSSSFVGRPARAARAWSTRARASAAVATRSAPALRPSSISDGDSGAGSRDTSRRSGAADRTLQPVVEPAGGGTHRRRRWKPFGAAGSTIAIASLRSSATNSPRSP